MIEQTIANGRSRFEVSNDKLRWVYELRFSYQVGVYGRRRRPSHTVRVITELDGQIVTAYPIWNP